MKQHKNRRIVMSMYAAAVSMVILTGFTSLAAEADTKVRRPESVKEESAEWNFSDIAGGIQQDILEETKASAEEAQQVYEKKLEEERKAAEEAARIAAEKAAAEAAAQADRELLASLIFCEAGNQPYEGQVAVGAVVMNRVKSGAYPNTISEVIYQSGQFTPAMTGWLDSVRANAGYTASAMQAAEEALAGSSPVGDCLYFSTGGWGMRIGDHYFH
ncbi:MAG TPA: cell wall hydrolase [Candidatus Mediterraneibacter caccogallinarum]|nr:cell wall hydrolase [Candidatus Mediterraneibacter caccogallinarum]